MYKFVFLINPISGGGEGKIVHRFVPEIMTSMGFSPEQWKSELTEWDRLREQIHEAASNTETLITVGGDGTVSTVLSVMLEFDGLSKIKVGLIPLGTGNDLARVLHLYGSYVNRGLLYLVRRLVMARSRPFDIWRVNGTHVLANYFSSGIDARVAHDFNKDRAEGKLKSQSVWSNKLNYVKHFFADKSYRLGPAVLEFTDASGKTVTRDVTGYRTVIVGNIPSFASGANPFTRTDMADGLLEIVCVPNLSLFAGAVSVSGFPVIGNLFKKRFLKSYHAKEIRLRVSEGEFHQLDGDDLTHLAGTEVHIEYGCQVQMLTLEPRT